MKKNRNVLLSICIPTYNRAEYLAYLLDSILESIIGIENEVEICISNNASTDSTIHIIEEFSKKITNFKSYNQEKVLLPGELNFYFVATNSTGKYIWVIGDDDKITPDAIRVILNELKNNPDLCIANCSLFNKSFEKCYKEIYYTPTSIENYMTREQTLKVFGTSLSFISINIIKSSLFRSISYQKYLEFSKYTFSYLYGIYSVLPEKSKIKFIKEPIVLSRSENVRFSESDWVDTFIYGSALVLEELVNYGYSKESIIKAKNKTIKEYIVKNLLSDKMNYNSTKKAKIALHKHYKNTFNYWIYIVPLIYTPNIVLKYFRSTYKLFKPLLLQT